MKKTIAKIMAAAMVISSIAAPNVLAAGTDEGTLGNVFAASVAFKTNAAHGGNSASLVTQGASSANSIKVELSSDEMTKIVGMTSDVTITVGTLSGSIYSTDGTDKSTIDNLVTKVNTDKSTSYSVTSVTADALVSDSMKTVDLDATDVAGGLVDTEVINEDTSKEVVNGDFKAVVNPYDGRRWLRLVINADGTWGVRFNWAWINANATNRARFLDWMAKIQDGDELDVVFPVRVLVAGAWQRVNLTVGLLNPDTVTYDSYWNGFVKLKGDNNTFIPIRVHYEVKSGLVNGFDNNALFMTVIGNQTIFGGNINAETLANQKLAIYNVNSYDLALLQSDVAKGKNLMLDQIYVFDGDDSYVTAWDNWNDSIWLKINDYTNVSVGKVDTIHARVFKNCKEKLVNAENAKFINNGAFRKNKQLKKIIVGTEVSSVKKINEKAFYDCKKLTTAKIKVNNIKHVGKAAFGGSTDKKSLIFKLKCGNKTQYNKAVKLFKKSGVKKAKFKKI